ncbi:hypothetical protein KIW84_072184 [Lathyrus oleraceus]|uniref:Uncharacterized protein n=1 Tax=Pisum sativum TaxID=3888 RepID=A0A9D4VLF5_PEA|nr:hypothetical protein KIW84_072184 [Pisum sativum]
MHENHELTCHNEAAIISKPESKHNKYLARQCSLATCDSGFVQCQYKIDDNELMEIQRRRLSDISDNERKDQIFSANHKQAFHSLAKQEHAFSGAMAGVCVSCCLHPVDTIKTVIQSCHASKKGTHGDEKHTKLITISRRLRMLLNNRNMGVGKDGLSNPVGG